MPRVSLHSIHGLANSTFSLPSFGIADIEFTGDFSYSVDSIIGEDARPSETIPDFARLLLESILKSSEDDWVMSSCHGYWPPADSNRHLGEGRPPAARIVRRL